MGHRLTPDIPGSPLPSAGSVIAMFAQCRHVQLLDPGAVSEKAVLTTKNKTPVSPIDQILDIF
ncbi:MAG: hypothetical protein ACTSP2_08900 [Alphaproteobacteria bacterium]